MIAFLQSVVEYFYNNPIESIGAILTVVCVWLNTRQSIWGWPVGIASITCYIWVFYDVYLLGDFLLNIYFLLLSLYGWYHWLYGKGNEKKLPVTRLTQSELVTYVIVGSIAAFIFGEILVRYTSASLPYWDATTTSFSVLAQWLLARKKIENWLFWIFVNILYIGIYFAKSLFATALVYAILLVLAVKGYQQWKAELYTHY
ncbi:MAG: nicotinamide riboside transporter PnuC [Cytophagales bacterium]|nr:nicotinamide riboside transporter PnuC [Bernardetiaceae bacterium]MDW8203431.1 nicotinamide riboside transporter PnuC [Cytophagales bacterium]